MMNIRTRAYDPESSDFRKLCQFIIQDNSKKKEYFVWQLGRIVDWKYGLWHEEKFFPNFFRENAQLWLDYFDELVGFAISEEGENTFYVFVKDTHLHIYEEIVQWVLAHWSDREGTLSTQLTDIQTAQKHTLEQYGFVSKGISEITRMYDLTGMATAESVTKVGFKLTDMATQYDLVGLSTLQVNAFRNQRSVTNLDLLTRRYVRESPIYKPAFDLAIVNDQGVYVAGCEAFIDYKNGVAEIERVCTHRDYRRKGLATAVIQACFHRLKNHGITTAYITGGSEGAIRLYGTLPYTREINRISFERTAP